MQPHKESVLCDQEETGATIFLPAVFFLGNCGIIYFREKIVAQFAGPYWPPTHFT